MIVVIRCWLVLLLVCVVLRPLPSTGADGGAHGGPEGGRDAASLTGQLLVATAQIGDPRFARTVIYMVSHDRNGAMGLVINRAFGTGSLGVLLDTMGIDPSSEERAADRVRLQYGGPVEPERGFVLHSDDYRGESTQVVRDHIAVSFGKDILHAMAEGDGPRHRFVALGYAGWAPGQLEGEIAREDWLTAPADKALIFSDDVDAVWEKALSAAGLTL